MTAMIILAVGLARAQSEILCSLVAGLGLTGAAMAVLMLPENATLFGGMLVITPLTSLFKVICLALALFTVMLAHQRNPPRHYAEDKSRGRHQPVESHRANFHSRRFETDRR